MPSVKPGESRKDYVARCVPIVRGEGTPEDQAVAKCEGMFDEHKKKKGSKDHPLVMNLLLDQKWGILPDSMAIIVAAVNGEGDKELAAALRSDRLSNTRNVELKDEGLAVLPIVGPIIPRASMFDEISGATSCQSLMDDFCSAMENPAVKHIILDIDSPGGVLTGINEFSECIKAARGVKPVTAYVSGLGASAAYWLLSAAEKVVMSPTAEVGSIGVMQVMTDSSEKQKKDGVTKIQMVSSVSPKKNASITSAEGKQEVQQAIDDLGEVMVDAIAGNRGVTADKVKTDYGQGGMFVSKKAVSRGMADEIMTFDQLIKRETAKLQQDQQPGVYYMGPQGAKAEEIKTAEDLKAQNPSLFESIKKAGYEEGVKAETARQLSLDSVPTKGFEEMLKNAKKDATITKETLAFAVLEETQKRANVVGTNVAADAKDLAEVSKNVGSVVPANSGSEMEAVIASMASGGNDRAGKKVQSNGNR